ncbi:MAG: HlyD family efflux transporter periplasmic adaptor subunit [Chloroflexi bacterium]|nr:HlyD family efflux transporter periplasmic adaptor subunit [Chloroflexota bacterium]
MKHVSLLVFLFLVLVGAAITSAQDAPLTATGSVEAARSVPLSFGMTGMVSEVSIEVGQSVHKGDVLAKLDTSDLELALRSVEAQLQVQQIRYDQLVAPARDVDVAAAQAALAAAQASANAAYSTAPSADQVQIAQMQSELARNQLWQAQLQRDQTQSIAPEFRQRAGAAPSVQDAQIAAGLQQADIGVQIADTQSQSIASEGPNLSQLGAANASVTQAQAQLDRLVNGPSDLTRQQAELSLEISQRAVANTRLQLEQGVIVAPFDAVVTANSLVVGQLTLANQPAITLADTSHFTANLLLGEADVVHIALDQPAQITADALPGITLPGTVTQIGLLPVPGEAVPTYTVQIALTQIDARLRAGMSVSATFQKVN